MAFKDYGSMSEKFFLLLRRICLVLYRMQGTGLPRIAEFIRKSTARYSQKNGRLRAIWVSDFFGSAQFCCDLSEHMGGQIFFRGCYSEGQLEVLSALLPKNGVFIDVGANQGEFTICAASIATDGEVHSFEPMSENIRKLEKNIHQNQFKNVFVHKFGLSDEDRNSVPIYTKDSKYADGSFHAGLGTTYSIPGRVKLVEYVNLYRLDNVLPKDSHVDLIKIDVEGGELATLNGAISIIERCQPYVIFEANVETAKSAGYKIDTLMDWFKTRSYRLVRIGPKGEFLPLDRTLVFCNLLAIPKLRDSKTTLCYR